MATVCCAALRQFAHCNRQRVVFGFASRVRCHVNNFHTRSEETDKTTASSFVSPFQRYFSSAQPCPQKETVTIHFTFNDGSRKTAKAKIGDNLLDTVLSNNLDIDGYGACEGTLACSTCHLIFKDDHYNKLPQKPTDEELDMLDLAYSLSDTSRLGCQVIVTKEMDGWEVAVPGGMADARD